MKRWLGLGGVLCAAVAVILVPAGGSSTVASDASFRADVQQGGTSTTQITMNCALYDPDGLGTAPSTVSLRALASGGNATQTGNTGSAGAFRLSFSSALTSFTINDVNNNTSLGLPFSRDVSAQLPCTGSGRFTIQPRTSNGAQGTNTGTASYVDVTFVSALSQLTLP